MPEGPEIFRSVDFLNKTIKGRRVISVKVGGRYSEKMPPGYAGFCERSLSHTIIDSVACKGKFTWWAFNSGWKLWCTYGMSGQWSAERSEHVVLVVEHAHAGPHVLGEDKLPSIYFNDARRFGTLKFVDDPGGTLTQRKLATLGPDMLSDPPSDVLFAERLLTKPAKKIAEVLMDQNIVSGVGNYVRAEALYLAEISPHRQIISLTSAEIIRLRQQIVNVMRASYASGGATISTYRQSDGSPGEAQRRFVVYGHKRDMLGFDVVTEKDGNGRTLHWVPEVQK